MRIRAARLQDSEPAAALFLELPGGLRALFPRREEAMRVARAVFASRRSVLSHRFAVVAEDRGEVLGVLVRLPGREWRRVRVASGLTMIRTAGLAEGPRLVRQGSLLDRLIPSVPRDSLYVPALAVAPGRRDHGIGTSLLLRAVGEAAESGHGAILLDVDAGNVAAIRFYERHGFVRVSARESSAARGMPAMGSVRMELALRGA